VSRSKHRLKRDQKKPESFAEESGGVPPEGLEPTTHGLRGHRKFHEVPIFKASGQGLYRHLSPVSTPFSVFFCVLCVSGDRAGRPNSIVTAARLPLLGEIPSRAMEWQGEIAGKEERS
jgi:hypothetical protein